MTVWAMNNFGGSHIWPDGFKYLLEWGVEELMLEPTIFGIIAWFIISSMAKVSKTKHVIQNYNTYFLLWPKSQAGQTIMMPLTNIIVDV